MKNLLSLFLAVTLIVLTPFILIVCLMLIEAENLPNDCWGNRLASWLSKKLP